MSEASKQAYVVSLTEDGRWLVTDTRTDVVFADCGKTERGHEHALNLARFHNMELCSQEARARRREQS